MLTLMRKTLVIEAVLLQILAAQASRTQATPRFETYCSRTPPGDSQVELQWPMARRESKERGCERYCPAAGARNHNL